MTDLQATPRPSAFLGTPFCPLSLEELYESIRAEKGLKKHEQPSLPALLSAAAAASRRHAAQLAAFARRAKRAVLASQLPAARPGPTDIRQGARATPEALAGAQGQLAAAPAARRAGDDQEAAGGSEGGDRASEAEQDAERAEKRALLLHEGARRAERLANEALAAAKAAESNAQVGLEPATLWATDEQGKKEFHGAFRGGFSAGYRNTAGSEEGWTSQSFRSSRHDRQMNREKVTQRPEDFMDEEDFQEVTTRRAPVCSALSQPPLGRLQPSTQLVSSSPVERDTEEVEEAAPEGLRAAAAAKARVASGRDGAMEMAEEGLQDDTDFAGGAARREGRVDAFCRVTGWLKHRFERRLKLLRNALEAESRRLEGSREAEPRPEAGRGDSEPNRVLQRGEADAERQREVAGKKESGPQLPPHLERLRRLQKSVEDLGERRRKEAEACARQMKDDADLSEGAACSARIGDRNAELLRERRSEEGVARGSFLAAKTRERALAHSAGAANASQAGEQGGSARDQGREALFHSEDRETTARLLHLLLAEEEKENKRLADLHRDAQELLLIAAEGKEAQADLLNAPMGSFAQPEEGRRRACRQTSLSSRDAESDGEQPRVSPQALESLSASCPGSSTGGAVQVFGGSVLQQRGGDDELFLVVDSDDDGQRIFESSNYQSHKHFAEVSGDGEEREADTLEGGGEEGSEEEAADFDISRLFNMEKKQQTVISAWFIPRSPPPRFDGVYRPPPPPSFSSSVLWEPPSALASPARPGVAQLPPARRAALLESGEQMRADSAPESPDAAGGGRSGKGDAGLDRDGAREGAREGREGQHAERRSRWERRRSRRSWGVLASEYAAEKGDAEPEMRQRGAPSDAVEPTGDPPRALSRPTQPPGLPPPFVYPRPSGAAAVPPPLSAAPLSAAVPAPPGRELPLWQGVPEEEKQRILCRLFGDGDEKAGGSAAAGASARETESANNRKTFFAWSRVRRKLPQWTREGELYPQAAHLEQHQKHQLQKRKQEELERQWNALQRQIRDVGADIEVVIKENPGKRMRWKLFVEESEREEAAAERQQAEAFSPLSGAPSVQSLPPLSTSPQPVSASPPASAPAPSSALSAAEDESEAKEFLAWRRRLALLRAQLRETRRAAAACAAEAWQEGTFGASLGERAFAAGFLDDVRGAETPSEKGPPAEAGGTAPKPEGQRRSRRDRAEAGGTAPMPEGQRCDGAARLGKEAETTVAERAERTGRASGDGSADFQRSEERGEDEGDAQGGGLERPDEALGGFRRREGRRRRETHGNEEEAEERGKRRRREGDGCEERKDEGGEEARGTLTLEKMLPLLKSRRTTANWAPNPTLCHRLGIPNRWARMPCVDDCQPQQLPKGGDFVFSESDRDETTWSSLAASSIAQDQTTRGELPTSCGASTTGPALEPVAAAVSWEAAMEAFDTGETRPPLADLFKAVFDEDPSDSSEEDD
ncbi:hypothetical protein BESB_040430 [Besnoitia besnoiti]|uniref:G patch domain-containing protein n=1 Tax=Besnoitia besnoiti TaxID=94643 RepID=A0A2A9MHX4_BESBE|nr:hypothetical protein BESB_040430 [Besnoitia besnoiti]PFH37585.1 hypothetical protein BESB_040430 [Besnoitia besnoiti]